MSCCWPGRGAGRCRSRTRSPPRRRGGGLLVAGLLVAGTVPRLLSRLLEPGRTYPLYGFHYTVQRMVSRLSNITPFNPCSGTVCDHPLPALVGYRLGKVEQTGSNFGMALHHEVPALS